MAKTTSQKFSLRPYYTFGLPLLALMGTIALVGVLLEVVVHFIK